MRRLKKFPSLFLIQVCIG